MVGKRRRCGEEERRRRTWSPTAGRSTSENLAASVYRWCSASPSGAIPSIESIRSI
jgi:hypothetical protein